MTRRMRTYSLIPVAAVVLVAGLFSPAQAATCNVPSGPHPDIQTAVDDIGCDPIVVASGAFAEMIVIDRSLSVQGAGSDASFIQGGVEVQSGTLNVTGFHISGPGDALWSHSGAEVSGFDLQVVSGGTIEPPLFADGFEDGTTNAWSGVSP